MRKIIECVPNISEGRDQEKIKAIVDAAARVPGVTMLDVDSGADTNRTVITFAGSPQAVLDGAFELIKSAASLIDMRQHKGEHPRMGATDVCPFVPVSGVTMEECAELARKLGERVGSELKIPVYLYEAAASRPERKSLAEIRKGEYEALEEKLRDVFWKPDFGPAIFNAQAGASVIGARPFLIAYNINLNTKNKKLATELAQEIREIGKPVRDANGEIVKDSKGEKVMQPGRFKECRAVGWYIETFGCAQVSINLTNYQVTNMQHVFDACDELARAKGLRVTGSELVGLVPKQALLEAGLHYANKQGAFTAQSESALLQLAVRSLGLAELAPFNISERVLEEKLKMPTPLADMTITQFVDELASDSVAPGGGSVAALAGALAGALAAMVCALSHSKPKLADQHARYLDLGLIAQHIKDRSLKAIDDDTSAFNAVIAAMRAVPKGVAKDSVEYLQGRGKVELAYQRAIDVPFSVVRLAAEALEIGRDIAKYGLEQALSDVAVAGLMAKAALIGAGYNVKINLKEISDQAYVTKSLAELQDLTAQAEKSLSELLKVVDQRLS
ncbi:glutamate formimidoyltransferase [bacterium]|nr:glutamate formimidoyltransferase [bacterium]